jgi:hypothetical protein
LSRRLDSGIKAAMELTIKTKLILAGAVLVLLTLFVPTPSQTAPEWTVHLVDERGAPIAGAPVMEIWQYSGWGENGNSVMAATDATGTVHLAPQREWGNLVERVHYHALALYDPHHNVYEPSAYVFAPAGERYTSETRGPAVWRGLTDTPLETTFVLSPCPASAKAAAQVGCPGK